MFCLYHWPYLKVFFLIESVYNYLYTVSYSLDLFRQPGSVVYFLTQQSFDRFATWLSISYKNFLAFLSQSGYMFWTPCVVLTFQFRWWKSLPSFLAFQHPSFWDCKGSNLFLFRKLYFFIFSFALFTRFLTFLSLVCGLQRCNFLSSLSSTFSTYFSG